MFGQGRPQLDSLPLTASARTPLHRWWCAITVVLLAALSVLLGSSARAADVDLNLRVAWGGGSPRCWTGEIRVQDVAGQALASARISDLTPLGLSPDVPGSMRVSGPVISIVPRLVRDYDGMDFRLQAPHDANLVVQLTPRDQADSPHQVTIPVSHLIDDFHSSLLDNLGNQLRLRRRPGDALRVRFDRDSLVLGGGEHFEFYLTPYRLGGETDSTLSCDLALVDSLSGEKVWEDTREMRIDATGSGAELGPLSVPMPERDGVFDLTIHVSRRRLPTPFAPTKTIAQRSVQLAVVASSAGHSAASSPWNSLGEIIPQATEVASLNEGGKSRLWNPLTKVPHGWWVPGSSSGEVKRPLGNGQSSIASDWGEGFVQLEPGGWQAYPLPTATLLRPHLLEFEYPADLPQGLNFRVIEPGASGVVSPFGPASGLDLTHAIGQSSGGTDRHRMVFWPKTETPLLLVANSRPDVPAVFGRIRILAGPSRLPASRTAMRHEGRLLAAYYDQPMYWEDSAATDAVDALTGRSLNDWRTFQEGGLRMVEYLDYAGYNGAMISVLHDGGSIYPSRLLESTARHDNGTFFGTGQDPVRKDVLEMLFRLFDRQGMTLIPMLRFSAPLPELQQRLLQNSAASTVSPPQPDRYASRSNTIDQPQAGIELVGMDGRTWRESIGANRTAGAYYNPLDPRVQQAMRRVVVELADRYGHHASFGGIAIRLGSDTYAQLPDLTWGVDAHTVTRFAQSNRTILPTSSESETRELASWIMTEQRDAWARWRAQQMADFYAAIQSDVTDRVPEARLYLAGADMLNHPTIQADLSPRLPDHLDVRQQMKRVGIDPWLYADSKQIVLMRPERIAPLISLEEQAAHLQLRYSAEMDRMFALRAAAATASEASGTLRAVTGNLFYHEPKSLVPASFRDVSPYGPERTSSWFLDQSVPAGAAARKRFARALATQDSQVMVDGGWITGQIPLEGLSELLAAYRQLPADRFETVRPQSAGEETQPVIVRRLSTGQRTYLYLVNHSPWPVRVSVSLDDRRPFTLTALGDRILPDITNATSDLRWNVELRPYDLVAARLSAPDVRVRDWQVGLQREVLVELRQSVDELRRRIGRLSDPEPLSVLTNPSFETAAASQTLAGWEHATGEGILVMTDDDSAHAGQRSLRIESSGPVVWVRSNPFPAPKTGRLDVFFWLKVDDPKQQPSLQLAVEGRYNGEPYYRASRVGAASPWQLTDSWWRYQLRVDNLPPNVTDLRVAIDLMGEGHVSVDDVQVFDLWFERMERNELLKLNALANLHLGKGAAVDCERLLRGYWAEFLRRNVPVDSLQLAEQTTPTAAGAEPVAAPRPDRDPAAKEPSTSWFQRVIPRTPSMPRLFR
jgi:hypothetical protein